MINNTKVKCDVNNCQYNNLHNCSLNSLNISCVSNNHKCHDKQETICKNFTIKKIKESK